MSGKSLEQRRLDVSFLFHFNQDLAPFGPAAAKIAYTGLLETLRTHPALPFQIQISGTLINNLQWFDERPLDLIREGIDAGQFEIWGSTYSQNVMYASGDAWTNEQQIRTHRRLLKKTFNAEPTGFWNPERVWTQDFVPLLARNGYRYTTVEQHILEETPGYRPGHHLRSTHSKGDTLTIVNDDTQFLRTFDAAVAGGSADSLLLYLRSLFEADTLDQALVAYFQDAEAMGLWQAERGEDPRIVWKNLSDLLSVLEDQDWIYVTTAERFVAAHSSADDLTPIADGQADWMITFARGMGYEDWYDYFARDPVQLHFRPLFDQVRDSLHTVNAAVVRAPTQAASNLFDRAVRTFLVHEYEYGASWYWTHDYGDFNLVRETLVTLLAVRYSLHPTLRTYRADVNLDGVEEIVMVDSSNFYVLTPYGGRLLYWFDLERGESLVGNENYSYYTERYVDGGYYIPALRGGRDVYPWLKKEDSWLLRKGPSEIFDWTFEIRRHALGDWIHAGGVLVDSLVQREYDVRLEDGSVHFSVRSGTIDLTKTVAIDGRRGLKADYTIRSASEADQSVEVVIESAFSPSYVNVMDNGATSLAYLDGSTGNSFNRSTSPGVKNVNTGSLVRYEFQDHPSDVRRQQVVFGLELNPVYNFELPAGEEKRFRFTLSKN